MGKIRFANIIFENPLQEERQCALFYRGSGQAWREGGSRFLSPSSSFDFTTYFNSLSVKKLRLYTLASSFSLHLELRGGMCEIRKGSAGNFSHEGEFEKEAMRVPASDRWRSFDLPFNSKADDVLLSFAIETFEEKVEVGECYWEIEAEEKEEIKLAIVSTTFKKEAYIRKTIRGLKEGFFRDFKDCHLFVIDNGGTLDSSLGDENVSILPNPNIGGSGGFARGMLEVKEKGKFTHILLMDDDVEICPESVKRTVRLLSLLKPEWRKAFIAGAMLNMDNKNLQMEDAGFMTKQGRFSPQKPVLGIDQVEGLIRNETFEPSEEMEKQGYASWWYCAMPLKEIERTGLPLPLFLRGDDAEYSLRAGAKLITMNSIGLWHMAFQVKYSAAVERYQVVRNVFAAKFSTGFAPDSDFLFDMKNSIRLELKKFGYDNASLVLDGFEDFLKGPRFLSDPLKSHEAFVRANKVQEQMLDFPTLQSRASDIAELQDFDVFSLTYQDIYSHRSRALSERIFDFASQNGQRIIKTRGEGYAVIPAEGWEYPASEIRGKRVLVLIDWFNRRGCIRTKDRERFEQISKRYERDMRYFKAHAFRLKSVWASAEASFVTDRFWEGYLRKAETLAKE